MSISRENQFNSMNVSRHRAEALRSRTESNVTTLIIINNCVSLSRKLSNI